MLSVVNIRAQISSVIDALSKAAVAEIAKVVEDGMVVLRMEICQRDNEILKLKGSIDILNHELKAASGGQDRGSGLHTGDDQQGSDDANNASNGNMLDEEFPPKDQNKVPTPEVQVKREPGEEEITKTIDALAQQGAEQSRFERESGTWRAISMYNAAGLGPSDYLGLAESPQSGPLVPAGGGSTSRGGSSGAVQQNPAAREQLGFSYYRNNYNPARWRNIKSLMFKRGFACLYCGKNFSRRAHLERHKLIHTGEKPYICEVCGRRFNQKSSVKEHMKIHQKGLQPKPAEMPGTAERQHVPEEKFGTDTPQVENGSLSTVKDELPKDDTQLTTDVTVKSGPEAKVATQPPNPCPSGSQPTREAISDPGEDVRDFDRVGELWTSGPHVKKNPGTSNGIMGKNMPYVPGHGSLHPAPWEPLRSFPSSGKLYRNPSDNPTSLQRYSSLGSFNDGATSASFNGLPWQSMDFTGSRRNPAFEPVKPKKCFVCPFCCKIFERSGHLERHVRIHTGEKPYGCQICGRFFNQKGSLKIHLKTHTNEMLEAQQQQSKVYNTQPLMISGASTSGPATLAEHTSDSAYDVSHGEQAVTVKLEPETDDVLPPGNAHGIADQANFLWTSIIEESGRSLSPLASTYSSHAASVVSHMVKDWLGPGSGPASETGGYGSPSKDVPLVKGKDDMEMMLQEQYAVMDTSQEGASTFEVPDLNDLEEGCSTEVDKQNGFICLTCGTSYECWSNFESHQCKDPS